MPIPQEILKLVERFDSQREAYQSGKYNEAQIRAERSLPRIGEKLGGQDYSAIHMMIKRFAAKAKKDRKILGKIKLFEETMLNVET